jgi:hypothetical protein
MSSELEEMAENIAIGERICELEQQYLLEHPKDFVGLAHRRFQLLAGHCHEIENVLMSTCYFSDDMLMHYAMSMTMGSIARELARR